MIASHNSCRFVSCIFMLPISCSTASHPPRCSVGFTSGDWRGHRSSLNWLSCIWNRLETTFCFVTRCIIMLKVSIRRWLTAVIKGRTWPETVVRHTVCFKQWLNAFKEPLVAKKTIPPALHLQPGPFPQGLMVSKANFGRDFPDSNCPVLLNPCPLQTRIDRIGTRCGLLLLQLLPLRVGHVVQWSSDWLQPFCQVQPVRLLSPDLSY